MGLIGLIGASVKPVYAQQDTSVASLVYSERNPFQEAHDAYLQALRLRLAQQIASQGPAATQALAVTFIVNTTDDSNDGACDVAHCSLREAIFAANTTTAADSIFFDIGGGGPQTISPTSALPFITQPVLLDGTTQPGYVDKPLVELDGSGAGATADGLGLITDGCTVRGLVINRFEANGILLDGARAFNNRVEGNFIGTDMTGTADLGNGNVGILLSGGRDNVVGGTTSNARNLISGNDLFGIHLVGTLDSRIEGNFIGTDITGTLDLGNTSEGIRVEGGSSNNIIGGMVEGARNIIAGNNGGGVLIASSNNMVQGNFIGTDVTGTSALGNRLTGVLLSDQSQDNIIGGTAAGAANVIASNGSAGVWIRSSTGHRIQGNYIGTDLLASQDLGNESSGVRLSDDVFDVAVGGTVSGAGNTIAHNTFDGISLYELSNGSAGMGNAFQGNSIFENGEEGIDLNADGLTLNDSGDADTGPNQLQNFPDLTDALYNESDELLVTYFVDTDPANATYPLTVEFFESDFAVQEGQVLLGRTTYTVTDYNGCGTPPCAKTINLGSTTAERIVATATDDAGNTSEFSRPVLLADGTFIVTNTNDSGAGSLRQAITDANAATNSNEPDEIHFDIDAQADPGCDSGTGVCTIGVFTELPTVTEAVVIDGETQTGADCGSDIPSRTLKISIDGSGAPAGTDGIIITSNGSTVRGLVINGYDGNGGTGVVLMGASANTVACNFLGTDATGTVDLGNVRGVYLLNSASNNTIGGTDPGAGNLISGNDPYGIVMISSGTTGNKVQGNFIGTDVTGTVDLGNTFHGVAIAVDAANNTIGGTDSGAGNLISGNDQVGVSIGSAGATSNKVQGNFIGTDVTGTADLGNTSAGVLVNQGPTNTLIGGTDPGAGNLISGNQDGIRLMGSQASSTSGTLIQGNLVGTDITGTMDLGNEREGVRFRGDVLGTTLGGAATGAGNIIAFNTRGVGTVLSTGTGNAILQNSIFSNTGLGIDLDNDGITPNDAGDSDTGPNNLQNFPDLISAMIDADGDLLVTYAVDTDPANATYPLTVEFFKADADDQEGQVFLEHSSYTTTKHGECGTPPCEVTVNLGDAATLGVSASERLVATATDDEGNTSEFSASLEISAIPVLLVTNTNDSGAGSLRQAMLDANASANSNEPDEIHFAIDAQTDPGCDSSTGVCMIAVLSELPTITEAVVVDGETQTGADCGPDIPSRTLKIVLNGSIAPSGSNGLKITSSGSTVRGLAINQFAETDASGIRLTGINADNNVIECNFLGTDVTGTLDRGNSRGMEVEFGASSNAIGGVAPGSGNLISGNQYGIILSRANTTDNMVQGNFIGTNAAGISALANEIDGIVLTDGSGPGNPGASNNLIGGTMPKARNVISGNREGILVVGSGVTGNLIQGNFIGTDLTGMGVIGNSGSGINLIILNPADITTIGGVVSGAGNVISGNDDHGISVQNAGVHLIQGNWIGTDPSGTMDLGNGQDGITLFGDVQVTIGGIATGASNVIAFNSKGVSLSTSVGTGNAILGNSLFENTLLGIDLNNNGLTTNDADDPDTGPNNLQNSSDLTAAVIDNSGELLVSYRVDTDPANATYPLTVEFFEADADDEEGQVILGRDSYSTTNHSGCGTPPCEATVNLGDASALGVSEGDRLVATTTDDEGNTSEFSTNIAVAVSTTRYVATSGTDIGNDCTDAQNPCATLPHAVNQANPGDVIELAAGTYDGLGLLIEKALTLQGEGVVVE